MKKLFIIAINLVVFFGLLLMTGQAGAFKEISCEIETETCLDCWSDYDYLQFDKLEALTKKIFPRYYIAHDKWIIFDSYSGSGSHMRFKLKKKSDAQELAEISVSMDMKKIELEKEKKQKEQVGADPYHDCMRNCPETDEICHELCKNTGIENSEIITKHPVWTETIVTMPDYSLEKKGYWEYGYFYLCGDWCEKENEEVSKRNRERVDKGYSFYSFEKSVFDCPLNIKTTRLNLLLSDGWKLQKGYYGEIEVWLKKWIYKGLNICPECGWPLDRIGIDIYPHSGTTPHLKWPPPAPILPGE